MTTHKEALTLTLAALKQIDEAMPFPVAKLAIMEAEKALAQPEQEPVAFPDAPQTIYLQVGDECPDDAKWKELIDVCWCDEQVFDNDIVYVRADTTPPQRTWVGLTEDEMDWLHANTPCIEGNYGYRFIKAIEAKLKEKNT
jgi:hypothetical protein